MGIQRNFARSLVQEFFTFQHPRHCTLLPYHQHIHLGSTQPPDLFLLMHLSSPFQQMDHHKLRHIHFTIVLHRHHLWWVGMESFLSLLFFQRHLPFQLWDRLVALILNLLLSLLLPEPDLQLFHHFEPKLILDQRK